MVLRPGGLAELRWEAKYALQRLRRMQALAEGGRVDFGTFEAAHSYAQGWAEALAFALELMLAEAEVAGGPLDLAVVELARLGLDPVAIANRCGLELLDVAEALARSTRIHEEEKGGQE